MDPDNKIWNDCNIKSDNFILIEAIQYVETSQQLVAVGWNYSYELNRDAFKSFCRKNNETFWTNCTGDLILPDGYVRLIQNSHGELLLLADDQDSDISDNLATNVLCMSPIDINWKDCTGSLNLVSNQTYVDGVEDEQGKWTLVGNHPNKSFTQNTAYLTSIRTETDWQINSQPVPDHESLFIGIYYNRETEH